MARSCPSCKRTYPDAVFFCGEDGTITVQDQSPADFDPRLGKQLGGYIAVARVADGAMGRVFEGRHPETKSRVAIKVLHDHVMRDRVGVERFKREYESALELNHPHVVKVLEFGDTPDGANFLTMEYLEGEELAKALGTGHVLAPARIVRILCQTAVALEHAHSFGFIHRDLKPENIFLCKTPDGDSVRILDFGSVKLQLETGAKLTAIGTTVGSPFYMSPEQAMGRSDVDLRTDVFALGAILYEMLTAKIAFDAVNVARILLLIMNENPAPPSSVAQSAPRALDAVVDKALRKNKEERYASARAFAEAVLTGFGLSGKIEDWAERPEPETAQALERASAIAQTDAPPAAKPERAPAPAASDRGEATLPKLSLPRDDSSAPAIPTNLNPGAMALIALAVVVVGSLLVLMFK